MRTPTSLALLALVLNTAPMLAAVHPRSAAQSVSDFASATHVITHSRLHNVGDVRVTIGNDGTFAKEQYFSDLHVGTYSMGFEFPANSRRMHSFAAGLWIAAIRGDDTLMSCVTSSGSVERFDFGSESQISELRDSVRGHQTFICNYTDTASDPRIYRDDRVGLAIRQISRAFASPPYDRFVIIEYVIRNIARERIRRPYISFFADCDVANHAVIGPPQASYMDDLSGFIGSSTIAYSFDNDGDPVVGFGDSSHSCASAMGIAPIYFDPPALDTSFNWWATNNASTMWGPELANNGNYRFGSGPRSAGDVYELLQNGERDYDQLWSAIDMRPEWRPPMVAAANNIANGLDTRFLLSFGFRDMAPDDSVRVVIVVAAGDSVHSRPSDYMNYFDATNPSAFYDRLDFTDLVRNVENARYAWSNNYNLHGAAPAHMTATPVADIDVLCSWTPAPFYHVAGYVLYQRRKGDIAWAHVGRFDSEQRSGEVDGLIPGDTYEFAVSSVDWNGVEGPKSLPVSASPGFPMISPTLVVKTTPQAIALDWTIPPFDVHLSPLTYINIYRRASEFGPLELYRRLPVRSDSPSRPLVGRGRDRYGMHSADYIDDSVTPRVTYFYSASVTNSLGNEGTRSTEVSATPLTLDNRGAVLFYTRRGDEHLVNYDSLRAFYGTWAARFGFDTITALPHPAPPYDTIPPPAVLARYECVVLVSESHHGQLPRHYLDGWLESYAMSGGKCVFIVRNHQYSQLGGPYLDRPTGAFHQILSRLFGIRTMIKEGWYYFNRPDRPAHLAVRFLGAQAVGDMYPDIDSDSLASMNYSSISLLVDALDIPVGIGHTPAVGAIDSLATGTEVLYRYRSAYDTSIYEGKPIAVRRITDSSAAILFNFPLSLMKHEQAWQALTQAVVDLGVDTTNYFPPTQSTTHSIINWLYGSYEYTPNPAWDTNRDGVIDIRDVVEILEHQ